MVAPGTGSMNFSLYVLSVKGITSTSYFSVHLKNTTFWMMEGKFLCSGDSLGFAYLSDKAN